MLYVNNISIKLGERDKIREKGSLAHSDPVLSGSLWPFDSLERLFSEFLLSIPDVLLCS